MSVCLSFHGVCLICLGLAVWLSWWTGYGGVCVSWCLSDLSWFGCVAVLVGRLFVVGVCLSFHGVCLICLGLAVWLSWWTGYGVSV